MKLLRQEFLRNTYLLFLLGRLHALIWELSAAFMCFSSGRSSDLRGSLVISRWTVQTVTQVVFCPVSFRFFNRPRWRAGFPISGLASPEAPHKLSSGFGVSQGTWPVSGKGGQPHRCPGYAWRGEGNWREQSHVVNWVSLGDTVFLAIQVIICSVQCWARRPDLLKIRLLRRETEYWITVCMSVCVGGESVERLSEGES